MAKRLVTSRCAENETDEYHWMKLTGPTGHSALKKKTLVIDAQCVLSGFIGCPF